MLSKRNLQLASRNEPEYASLARSIAEDPQDARAHFELGRLALRCHDWDFAAECFTNVTRLAPLVEAGFFNLGNAWFESGRYHDAVEAYENAFELEPSRGTLNNIGNTFAAANCPHKAIQAYRRALEMPQLGTADSLIYGNMGRAYTQIGEWHQAAECYRQAFLSAPSSCSVLKNHLRGCLWSNKLAEGLEAMRSMEQKVTFDLETYMLSAQINRRMHRYAKAMANLLAALEISPDDDSIFSQIAVLNFERGRRTESLFCYERARSAVSKSIFLHSQWLRLLNHRSEITPAEILSESVGWVNHHTKHVAENISVDEGVLDNEELRDARPLKVGFVLNEDAQQGTCQWLEPLLHHFDPSKISVVCYSDAISIKSDALPHIRSLCTWIETAHLSDDALTSRIRADETKVLFDLVSHGLHNRLRVFAARPARIHVSWLGNLATTGLPQMDYVFADETILPDSLTQYLSEKPVRLPIAYATFQPPMNEVPCGPAPFLRNGWVTFGSSSDPEKLSEEVMDAWSRILLNVDNSKLALVHAAFRDESIQFDYRNWFENRGVEPHKVIFGTTSNQDSHFANSWIMDVALDPFPVNEPLAALESLWMGVPVICLMSDRMSGRTVASFLSQLDLPSCVANSIEEYVKKAIQLGNNPLAMNSFRQELRDRLLKSPICNVSQFTNFFQDAILEIWSHR